MADISPVGAEWEVCLHRQYVGIVARDDAPGRGQGVGIHGGRAGGREQLHLGLGRSHPRSTSSTGSARSTGAPVLGLLIALSK